MRGLDPLCAPGGLHCGTLQRIDTMHQPDSRNGTDLSDLSILHIAQIYLCRSTMLSIHPADTLQPGEPNLMTPHRGRAQQRDPQWVVTLVYFASWCRRWLMNWELLPFALIQTQHAPPPHFSPANRSIMSLAARGWSAGSIWPARRITTRVSCVPATVRCLTQPATCLSC